jgi:hypothetical protein
MLRKHWTWFAAALVPVLFLIGIAVAAAVSNANHHDCGSYAHYVKYIGVSPGNDVSGCLPNRVVYDPDTLPGFWPNQKFISPPIVPPTWDGNPMTIPY